MPRTFGQRVWKGRRYSRRAPHRGGNKRRTAVAKRNQFTNQLGGWSKNTHYTSGTFDMSINTEMRPYTIGIDEDARSGKAAVTITANNDLEQIQNTVKAFQRFRIKKATLFYIPDKVGETEGGIVQLTIGKLRRGVTSNGLEDSFATQGAESKVFRTGTAYEAEPLRVACYYPTLEYEVDATAANAPTVNQPGWVPTTEINNPGVIWNAFLATAVIPADATAQTNITGNIYYNLQIELKDPFFGS